jgi:hypothetical protein
MSPRRLLGVFVSSLAPCIAVACSDSTTTPAPAGGDSGPDASAPEVIPAPTEAIQSGRVITAQQETAVEGATITVGGKSVTTAADGKYAIAVPKDSPFRMRVAAEEHYTLLEQEYSIGGKATLDRGDTQLLSRTTANLLVAFLQGYDKTKGLVSVRVSPLAPCASEEGATVTLDPPGAAQFRYVSGSIPREGQPAVKAGESISVIFYNVEPGVKVRPVVTHPSCEVVPFPVAVGDVSYTNAEVTPEPGEVLTFVRAYVGPAKAVDAGTD